MDDLISRQTAIKAIEDLQDCYNGFSDTYDKACIIGALEEVPSAQPERCEDCRNFNKARLLTPQPERTGRWKVSDIPKGKMKYCSECGFGQYIADERQYGYCPNCGARMEVKE